MSQDDLATIFRRSMEAYTRGDYEAALAGFDPEIEWSVAASVAPDAATYHGHEGVTRFWETWAEAISEMALEIEDCRRIGENRVLAITRAHGTGAGSDAPVASPRFAEIADFRDGRVVRVQVYGNVGQALEAVGPREYAMSQEDWTFPTRRVSPALAIGRALRSSSRLRLGPAALGRCQALHQRWLADEVVRSPPRDRRPADVGPRAHRSRAA